MPGTRDRIQAPSLRPRHHSPEESIGSIPSDEFQSADEEVSVPEAAGRGPMAAMLAEYRTLQVRGGDEQVHEGDFTNAEEDDGDDVEDGDGGMSCPFFRE